MHQTDWTDSEFSTQLVKSTRSRAKYNLTILDVRKPYFSFDRSFSLPIFYVYRQKWRNLSIRRLDLQNAPSNCVLCNSSFICAAVSNATCLKTLATFWVINAMNSCVQIITRIVFEIYLWYFELKTLQGLTIYARQYLDANRLVFHTLYFWNEVGDPQFFLFCSSDTSNSLSECSKNLKNLSTGKLSRERRDKTILFSLSMSII